MMKALTIDHLTTHYGDTPALWDIELSIPEGVMVGIIGPNGAGKSTLLKTILGLIPSISGHVSLLGQPLEKVRGQISYVPQRGAVDWTFPITVEELVLMGRYSQLGLFRRLRKADRDAAKDYLKLLGLEHLANRQISQLSGGQQQRAFLARALMQNANLYFLDEPFAGIDQTSEQIIIEQLHTLRDQGKTIFIVHHDLHTAGRYFDWGILLNLRLIACGPAAEALCQENLHTAYGTPCDLFEEAFKRSRATEVGMHD